MGGENVDLVGHVWTVWHATREPLTRTELIGYPGGVDLLPILGGWADIWLASKLMPMMGLIPAFNAVTGLYVALAGVGGHLLARSLGASAWGGWVAGTVLQLEPFMLHHLQGGRTEQIALGPVAFVLVSMLRLWKRPTRRNGVWLGMSCAAVAYTCWEYTLLLVPVVLGLGLTLGTARWSRDHLRAVWTALLTVITFAGPWVFLFGYRTSQVRSWDDGGFGSDLALQTSIPLLEMFRLGDLTPSICILIPIVLLPWTHRRRDRRIWFFLGGTLALCWLLATGPAPTWTYPSGETARWWAPFAWFQALPISGWFHWPNRLVIFWCLIGAGAAGLAVTSIAKQLRVRGIEGVLAVGFAGGLLLHSWHMDRWPVGGWEISARHPAQALAQIDGEGAVLDVPVFLGEPLSQRYQILQMIHERPILAESHLRHLRVDGARAVILNHPAIDWVVRREGQPSNPPVDMGDHEREMLLSKGFRFLVLHQRGLAGQRHGLVRRTYQTWLGEPVFEGPGWTCWDLQID